MDIEDLLLGQLFLQPGYDFWPHAGLFTQPLEEVPTRVGFIHHAWLWALATLLWGMCVQLNSMQDMSTDYLLQAYFVPWLVITHPTHGVSVTTAFRSQQPRTARCEVIQIRISGHQPTLS